MFIEGIYARSFNCKKIPLRISDVARSHEADCSLRKKQKSDSATEDILLTRSRGERAKKKAASRPPKI